MLQVLLEGYAIDELLKFTDAEFAKLNFLNQPLAFKAGSNTIIAQFIPSPEALVLQVTHVDSGGHGALPPIASLASRYAKRENLPFIDWRIALLNCVNLNPKLRQVLQRRGFGVRKFPVIDTCYCIRAPQAHPWPPNTSKEK